MSSTTVTRKKQWNRRQQVLLAGDSTVQVIVQYQRASLKTSSSSLLSKTPLRIKTPCIRNSRFPTVPDASPEPQPGCGLQQVPKQTGRTDIGIFQQLLTKWQISSTCSFCISLSILLLLLTSPMHWFHMQWTSTRIVKLKNKWAVWFFKTTSWDTCKFKCLFLYMLLNQWLVRKNWHWMCIKWSYILEEFLLICLFSTCCGHLERGMQHMN